MAVSARSMRARGLQAALLLTLTVLAGCAGKGGSGAAPDGVEDALDNLDLKATDSTGILRGVIVDDAIKPLSGVAVGVVSGAFNQTVTTKDDGLFGLDGLQPGTYFLTATKAGYLPIQRSAEVVAGDDTPAIVKIQLTADVTQMPYVSSYQYDAFIGCSVTTPTVSAAACDIVGPVKEATNNEFLVNYDADKPPMWVQSEAVWDSSQPAGDDLSLSLTDFSHGPQIVVADAQGKSPIFWAINETVARDFNYGVNNSLTIRLFSTTVEGTDQVPEDSFQGPYSGTVYPVLNSTPVPSTYGGVVQSDPTGLLNNPFGNPDCIEDAVLFDTCFDLNGAGVVVNQKVTVFTHIFYGYTPPEGWRFSESNAVPLPP